ncbi:MAG: biotin--[acetyl-CoA-carboxylase] ligase [Verrucomicrobia bacterium]|nr:biotin--[acetyl-CoA-carboxylase] ligase [Verrucomicrobiota bacterium]
MPSTELVILRELLAREPGFVSGAVLASKLGLSRVAIWQHMEKLREQGFAFEAARARGYRITRRPAGLHATFIAAHLKGRARDFPLTLLEEVDSTNDEAARQLSTGRTAPFVIIARRQTRGRGRLGRTWHSEANGNLYASFAFRPQLPPARMPTFTLWMGVNICELIANFCRTAPGIKWPNDILFDGRKAGGMLTEARVDADQIRDLVFGLGLNLNSPAGSWPSDLARRAISLAEQTAEPLDPNRFTAALIGRVRIAYEQFIEGSHRDSFADLWNRHDVLRGKPVTVLQGPKRFSGVAAGVDDAGSLLVRPAGGGRPHRFHAGEVTLEKAS